MSTRARIESEIKKVQKRVNAITAKRKAQVVALRAKAGEAALHWVMSHEDRINAFRRSVRGTPVAKALDTLDVLIEKLKSASAKPAKKAPARKAAAKKAAKKKPAAKKARSKA